MISSLRLFLIFSLFLGWLGQPLAYAQYYPQEIKKFQTFNPDVQKYEFIDAYVTSLTYLYKNEKKQENANFDFQSQESVRSVMDFLITSNVNLRIARNLLAKYQSSGNQFIVKASDMFTVLCDEQIAINKKELSLLQPLYDAYAFEKMEEFNREAFFEQQQKLASQRKVFLEDLFKATLFVTKILVSSQSDINGRLESLAVTQEQRQELIFRLDNEFLGEVFKGEPREGQTYLQASVATLRSVLEDSDWSSYGGVDR